MPGIGRFFVYGIWTVVRRYGKKRTVEVFFSEASQRADQGRSKAMASVPQAVSAAISQAVRDWKLYCGFLLSQC